MAKTIVIPDADYSANKLDKVSFGGSVPCTGIELNESSYSLSDYDPVTVGYVVTPNNTTDNVVITSSDTDVVIIEDGKIKAVGLGTATITATCGNFSDTATVFVAIVYDENYVGAARTKLDTSFTPNIVQSSKWSKFFTACGNGESETTYESVEAATPPGKLHGIKLPKNTAKIKVGRSEYTGGWFSSYEGYVVFTKDEHSGNNSFPTSIKPISQEEIYLKTTAEYVLNVPSGADSVFVSVEFSSTPSDFDADIATTGFTIAFLAE